MFFSTVGYGEPHQAQIWEMIFSMLVELFGSFVFAIMKSSISNI